MSKVYCLECKHWQDERSDCEHRFRWASNAAGRGVNCREDVWFCQDYEEKESEDKEQ
jgi:hypothetical protein